MADLLALPGLSVSRAAPEPLYVLHCDPVVAGAVGAATGLDLPAEMLHASASTNGRALHLAPDEWLLIGWAPSPDLALPLDSSLVDVSSRALTLEIEGDRAALLLSTGCPLDLAQFPPGTCTRTVFGKVQVMLERRQDCFRMQYGRSFDDYVTTWIETAAPDLPGSG